MTTTTHGGLSVSREDAEDVVDPPPLREQPVCFWCGADCDGSTTVLWGLAWREVCEECEDER